MPQYRGASEEQRPRRPCFAVPSYTLFESPEIIANRDDFFGQTVDRGFVAQVFNLLCRRFSNRQNVQTKAGLGNSECLRISHDLPTRKSAIRQAGKPAFLRYRVDTFLEVYPSDSIV